MLAKPFCDRSLKYLLGVIVFLVIVTVVETKYFMGLEAEVKAQTPAAVAAGALPPKASSAPMIDAITGATARVAVPVAFTQTGPAGSPVENMQNVFGSVAATTKPTVAHIEVRRLALQPGTMQNAQIESIGSGVMIDSRGYILTNYHVVENPLQISATLYSGGKPTTYQAELIDSDAQRDIAIIRIPGSNFPTASLGDSSSLQVGDWVMAIGSPLDFARTVSLGIVSAVRGAVKIGDVTYFDLIQTDAHINKGNSGGPLVNMDGQVVGVNSAIFSPAGRFTGVGFALPINNAKPLLKDLNIAQEGMAARPAAITALRPIQGNPKGWFGIRALALNPALAAQFGVPVMQGVYIVTVLSNSPAETAALQSGDTILWVDNRPITDLDTLWTTLAAIPVGQTCAIRICRAGQIWNISAIPRLAP